MINSLHPILRNRAAVIFDVGGTLVHPDWCRLGKLVEAEAGRIFTPEQMHRAFYLMLHTHDADLLSGSDLRIPREPHWTFLATFRALGVDEGSCRQLSERLTQAHRERHLWCKPDPEASSALLLLKSAGLRLAVISNTEDGRVNESLALADLASHFEFLLDSHHVGCSKPDEAIFKLALERLGIEPHEAAYVGDSYGYDVMGAQRTGLHPIFLDRCGLNHEAGFARISSLRELVG